jgi:hypothetical protein
MKSKYIGPMGGHLLTVSDKSIFCGHSIARLLAVVAKATQLLLS